MQIFGKNWIYINEKRRTSDSYDYHIDGKIDFDQKDAMQVSD
jgi:hypothetical protein